MKTIALHSPLICCAPALALAQTAPRRQAAAKPPPSRGQAAPPSRRPKQAVAQPPRPSRKCTPIDDDPSVKLTDADLAVAKRVYVGNIPCELGATVKIDGRRQAPGLLPGRTQGLRYRMHPVESRTGAIRLEDPKRGAMWLQLGNKSMLMNQKPGQRLADECQSPAQVDVRRRT